MEKSRKQKENTNSLSIIESSHPSKSAKSIKKTKKQLVDMAESINSLLDVLQQEIKRNNEKNYKHEIELVMDHNRSLMDRKDTMITEIRELKFQITEFQKMNDELRGSIDKFRSQVEEFNKQNISNSAVEQGQ